jgi:FixJ family two-component response regulator
MAQEAVKHGASDYIAKPFESANLKSIVSSLVNFG